MTTLSKKVQGDYEKQELEYQVKQNKEQLRMVLVKLCKREEMGVFMKTTAEELRLFSTQEKAEAWLRANGFIETLSPVSGGVKALAAPDTK